MIARSDDGALAPPRASVVMPARNAADTIDRALSSVLSDGRDDVEVVVVDDGSTDATAVLASAWDHVRVEPNPTGSFVGALNYGLDLARSDLIAHLDADDWFLPGGLDALIEPLESDPDLAVVVGSVRCEAVDGRRLDRQVVMPTTEHLRLVAMVTNPITHSASAYRRSVVRARGGYRADGDVQVASDYDLWMRMLDAGDRFVGVSDVVGVHVIAPTGLTSSHRADADARSRRLRAGARRRWGAELAGSSAVRRLGRSVARWNDRTGQSAMFTYAAVRLVNHLIADRQFRRAAGVMVATIGLGPHIVVRGVIETTRGRARRRRARAGGRVSGRATRARAAR